MPEAPVISHVSDTSRWVAVYRAWEYARPDPLFVDPYADRLAGERGRAIAAKMPRQARSGWPIIIRTHLIDDLVRKAIAEGCDRVLNLAAGLDTRPYRMDLPATLDWVEADLGPLLEEKERLLAGLTPTCRLRREPVDLTDASARGDFLARATSGSARALILTEGLLPYLDDDVVRALGRDLARAPGVRWWMLDIASPAIVRLMQKGMGSDLANAPMKFAPPEGIAFIERLGWQAREVESIFDEAIRRRRVPLLLRALGRVMPRPDPRALGHARWSAVVRFERAGEAGAR